MKYNIYELILRYFIPIIQTIKTMIFPFMFLEMFPSGLRLIYSINLIIIIKLNFKRELINLLNKYYLDAQFLNIFIITIFS